MKIGVLTGAVTLAAGALLLAVPHAVFAQNLDQSEKTFVAKLASGNIAEIELGQLAQKKAAHQAVKSFGNRMVQDHTTLQNDLKNWAAQNHVSLPTEASQTDISQKRKLEGLSGAAFDSAYMEDMLSDHKNDIAEVQKMAENASNPQVKQLAQKTLPLLEDHERVAENVAGQLQITSTKGLNQPEHPSGEASRSKRQ